MDFKEGGYVSPECIVLTVKRNKNDEPIIDPLLLSVLLRSDLVYGQIMHLISGIGRPRLSITDMRRVRIPSADYKKQRRWRETYLSEMNSVDHIREMATGLLRDAREAEQKAIEQLAKEFV
jgi:hypothetical protein